MCILPPMRAQLLQQAACFSLAVYVSAAAVERRPALLVIIHFLARRFDGTYYLTEETKICKVGISKGKSGVGLLPSLLSKKWRGTSAISAVQQSGPAGMAGAGSSKILVWHGRHAW